MKYSHDAATNWHTTEIVPNAPTTADAFLAWTATLGNEYEGYKLELSRGQVAKMTINVSRGHVEVCYNILRILTRELNPDHYLVSTGDFGVRHQKGIRFPDVLVEPRNKDRKARVSENPVFIAEVLSPSTTAIDFLEKLPEYTSILSLREYLICSQDEPLVWLTSRSADGNWPEVPNKFYGKEISLPISGLCLVMEMSEIYRGIPEPGL